MSRFSISVLSAVAALVVVVPASATSTAPLFTVARVINHASLGTIFSCVNTGATPTTVTVVNVVDGSGATIGTGTSATLNQDQTWVFGTTILNGFDEDTNMGLANSLDNGSAKIVSTSKAVMCNAFIADTLGSPPASMTTLRVVGGTKQKV